MTEGFGNGAAGRLRFDGPVDRSLVHRHADTEVFVTDHLSLGDNCFAVAARLPASHSYFTDDPLRSALVDPMLLLECSRQAGTLVAHSHLGVPADTAFLITEWSFEFDADSLMTPHGAGPDPATELTIVIEARDLKKRGNRLLGATLVSELYLSGRRMGSSTICAGYPTRPGYESFRTMRRSSPAPLSDSMSRHRVGTPPGSRGVGRTLDANVVVSAVRAVEGGLTADLDVPVGHPVFYDHPLDHVPATALLEAARQAALLAVAPTEGIGEEGGEGKEGREGGVWRVSAMSAGFQRFVELDSPTTVSARVEPDEERRVVRVTFEQGDAVACHCELTVFKAVAPEAG